MTDTETDILEVRERGPGTMTAPPVGELPAGGALWPVPHHLSKISVINQIARAYRWSHDEALRNSRSNAVAMLRDTEIRDALETRFIPTVQLAWHLEPRDESDPKQVDACKKLTQVLLATPRLQDLHKAMLWAIWYGRAGAQLLTEWDYSSPDGEKRLVIKDHRPINGDSLVAQWSGGWGLLVNSAYPGEKQATDRGYAHFFTPREKEAVLIHMHNPEDVDYYESDVAGQIRGSGVRGHVYWYWWLASNFMALAEDYAERFCNGLWKAYFDQSNPDAKSDLEAALAAYRTSHVLLLPRNQGTMNAVNDVTVEQVSSASPQFLMEIIQMLRQKIRSYITGSNVSAETSINAGGDAVGVDEDKVSRVIKYDAERLGECYDSELMPMLTRYNCGNVPPPFFRFDCDKPNAGAILGYASAIKTLGGDVDLDSLYAICGLPIPQPGSNVSSQIQPMSATAATQVPMGVPTASSVGDQQPPSDPQPQLQAVPQQQGSPVASSTGESASAA